MDTQDMLTNFMEIMKASNDSLRADMINNNNNINNINDNINNQDFSNKIESLQEKIKLRSIASSKAGIIKS